MRTKSTPTRLLSGSRHEKSFILWKLNTGDRKMIPRVLFERLVREVAPSGYIFTDSAMVILQRATEDHVLSVLHESVDCMGITKRSVLTLKDIQLARRIRGI